MILSLGKNLFSIDIYIKQVNLPGDVPSSGINIIFPDSSGYIWIGTNDGLFRWDGYRAKKYPVVEGIKHLNITALTQDKNGIIWAGCADGSIYQTSGQKLQNWKLPDSSVFSVINDLLFDKGGKLWWGTNGSGLFYFDGKKTTQIGMKDGLPDNYIYTVERGYFGEIWATTDRGVAICKIWENIFELSYFDKSSGLNDDIVRVVKKDENGNMWLGFHEGGICYYNNLTKLFTPVIDPSGNETGQINSITCDLNGTWVTSQHQGLLYISESQHPKVIQHVQIHGESIPTKIEKVFKDNLGNLWILDKNGLFVSSAGAFTRISKKSNFKTSKAKAIVNVGKDSFWTAEHHTITEVTKTETKKYLSGFINETSTITSMKADEKGNFWIGTFGDGVVVFDPKTKKHRFITEKNGLVNNSVLDISIRQDEVWIATLGGASNLTAKDIDGRNFQINSFDKESGLGNNFIYNILQDSKGRVWFGTDGNGLVKFENNGFTFYDEKSGLEDDVVYSIAEDSDGDLWLSTAFSGVFHFDGLNFHNYTTAEGLIGTNIFSLACKDEFIFILTENGLEILNKTTDIFTSINEELDLKKVNADLNKVYSADDLICFVTEQGIIHINTRQFSIYPGLPSLTIDKVSINLEPVRIEKVTELNHDENKLEFEYNGFWYMAPGKIHYSTRLIGYDSVREATYDRRSSYANLSPGKYKFEVQAYLDNIASEANPVSINFQILKPIYFRWWFILLVAIFFLFFLFWMIRLREKQLKLAEARKKEKLEFEFQTLKNQINPHFLFNSFSTLISIIEENPNIAVEYTEKLSDFFRNIIEVKEQELIPLKEELEMMRNYFYIQHKRFGNNFSLKIELDEFLNQSKIPPLTLQLLAENAIKHNIVSKTKPLVVKISNNDKFIIVSNNLQKKKQHEQSTGIGLPNIKERYRFLTGKEISIKESNQVFEVILPIINN